MNNVATSNEKITLTINTKCLITIVDDYGMILVARFESLVASFLIY